MAPQPTGSSVLFTELTQFALFFESSGHAGNEIDWGTPG